MKWLQKRVRQWQRTADVKTIWPECKASTKTRREAEIAFRVHMDMDPAYNDLDDFEKLDFLRELP